MRIISNVMKLQSGGEPKRVRYISAPSRNINRGIGDPDRVTSVGDEIAKAREWEANWYKGRKATGKFEDQLDDTTYNFMIDRITNSPITVRDGASYRADGANGVTTIKDGEAIITANADPTYERKAESFGNTLGSILTHELDHAATIKDMNVWGQTQEEFDKNSIKSATPSLIKVNDIIKGGIFKGGSNDYINNAAEVKARLNSMRRDAKMDLNPGAVYGGGKGLNITKNKLATKFIKGDADLGWSALNKDHWIFNKEARTPTNMAMASINRVMPFLSNVEKTPARVAAYKVGRRTKGNASVSLKDIKNNDSTYTGSATPEGNNGDRDLLGLYLFQNDPLISRSPWFQRISKSFKPAKGQGFNYDKRYSELYPGIEGRRYQMQSVVKSGHPLRFNNVDEFNNYSNGIGKLQGKEGDMVIEMPDGFQTFRQPGTNYVGPIDDVGGHVIKIDYNKKGKLTQISQDMWKFNPRDYAKRWSGDNVAEGVRATKQAALMDKVGTPFILQQENPIYIGSRRVWDSIKSIPKNPYIRRQPLMQGALLTMKKGGSLVSDGRRFKFKDSPLVRNSRTLNNKRDMRKKFMKSDRPTYSTNRVRKGQDGLQFVSYTPVETPDIPKFESSDVFSTYNIPIVRDESVVSQPKVDEPRIDEPIIESAVNTPMKRELFNIKPSKGLDEFNKWYDEVEKEDPEAKHYRQFLTKMAEQESGFNSAIQNRAGAPAYGYFQFMQDGKKYNNITAYAGTDIETFRNNPKLQIKAAIKLAKSFERGFNKKDLELAAQKGYTKFGLLGGAWLAGNGGVRKYLQGLANPSDRHWSKSGSGTDVASRIQMFNF